MVRGRHQTVQRNQVRGSANKIPEKEKQTLTEGNVKYGTSGRDSRQKHSDLVALWKLYLGRRVNKYLAIQKLSGQDLEMVMPVTRQYLQKIRRRWELQERQYISEIGRRTCSCQKSRTGT